MDPWQHEPNDLVAFLIEVGALPPDEPLLQMLNYYTTRDFDTADLGPRKPSSIEFDRSDKVHQTLCYAVKDIQRRENKDPTFNAPIRHTWKKLCITFCIGSLDPTLAHPHFLKAFLYHIRNRLWCL